MYKGTTPTITLTFPEEVTFSHTNVYVSFANEIRRELLRKMNDDLVIDGNVIEVYLTQAETLSLPHPTLLQVNWTYAERGTTKRACSNIVEINNNANLVDEVLP